MANTAPKTLTMLDPFSPEAFKQRVMSVVHMQCGDRILIVYPMPHRTKQRFATKALFSDRCKAKFSDDAVRFMRRYPKHKSGQEEHDYFHFMRVSKNGPFYEGNFASDMSMSYDAGAYPNSTNYVLNLDTLAKKGIKVLGYES